MSDDFHQILIACKEIARENPSHVFIGGVAVYLHAVNNPSTRKWAEASHDADLMISLDDYGVIRDTDEVISNRRLGKHQIIRDGMEFDIYVEHQNNLAVPYDEISAHAVSHGGIRIAALEHLLILKLNALLARKGSAKGAKDERDIVAIAHVCQGKCKSALVRPYLREAHVDVLGLIEASLVFTYLARGNAKEAKRLQLTFSEFVTKMSGGKKSLR